MKSWIMVTLLAVSFALASFLGSDSNAGSKKLSPVEDISKSGGY